MYECVSVHTHECVLLDLGGRGCEGECLRVSGSERVLMDLGVCVGE